MAKYCLMLWLLCGALIACGRAECGPGETLLKPVMTMGPKPLLGFKTTVLLESWDENEGNDDKKRLYVYIDMGKEARSVSYEDLSVVVLDPTGNAIEITERGGGKKLLESIHDERCAFYTLQLKGPQKVEVIMIRWKDSVQTFRIKDAQVVRPSIET